MTDEKMKYEIRLVSEQDTPELARHLTLLGHPTSTEEIEARWNAWAAEGNACLVAQTRDGTIIGMLTLHRMIVLHRPLPVGRITALVVEETLRGSGIGRALVDAAEKNLANAGCGILELTSNAQRVDAHMFYERLGYERTSVRFAKTL